MRVWALVYAKLLITQFVTTVCANTPIILFNYNRVLFRAISDTTQVKRLTFFGSGAFDIAFDGHSFAQITNALIGFVKFAKVVKLSSFTCVAGKCTFTGSESGHSS